jgi:hypothetical protein
MAQVFDGNGVRHDLSTWNGAGERLPSRSRPLGRQANPRRCPTVGRLPSQDLSVNDLARVAGDLCVTWGPSCADLGLDAVRWGGLAELARALASLPPLGAWVHDAACGALGAGAEVFTSDHPNVEELELAEATCWRCPVLTECRAYAAQGPVYGLWGAHWHSGRSACRQPAA